MALELSTQTYYAYFGGVLAGCGIVQIQRHITRRKVWLPFGWCLLFLSSLIAAETGYGLMASSLAGAALAAGAAAHIPKAIAVLPFAALLALFALIKDLSTRTFLDGLPTRDIAVALAILSGVVLPLSIWRNRRPIGECLLEWPIRIMYRFRAVGPGMDTLPRTGPVLVIGNHATYLDPCWVMIRLPRDLTPIMYGEYFNRWGVHFYMKHLINAIPSGVGTVRRETPEIQEMIRRLDRGEGVLIFPEGWVRRKEDEELRRFAQGAWRILKERPATPVVACWIEGGWGSWTSFWNGPPLKGKPIDFRRPITIYVAPPVVLESETLADQRQTRERLREMVLEARAQITARSR
jgi:1-acyl-sn-glycerol-3-phosphate acyltransferase